MTGIRDQESSIDLAVKPVQNGCGRRRRGSAEQKLTVSRSGGPRCPWTRSVEVCRERRADVPLEMQPRPGGALGTGEIASKSRLLGWQKRVEGMFEFETA